MRINCKIQVYSKIRIHKPTLLPENALLEMEYFIIKSEVMLVDYLLCWLSLLSQLHLLMEL